MTSPPEYSLVVPAYESDKSVQELVERAVSTFENTLGVAYEIILVDDGSKSPATWATLTDLATRFPHVLAIRLMRNYGKSNAVMCGLARARGKWIITMDDDLQHRPEDIPILAAKRDRDVVIGQFLERKHGPFVRLSGSVKGYFDRHVLGLPHRMSPFKLIKAEVVRGMLATSTGRPFIAALISHVTMDCVTVTVTHEKSRLARSRYTIRRRIRDFADLAIGNSSVLMRVCGLTGICAAVLGFSYASYIALRWLMGFRFNVGWASLAVIELVLGGLILVALGVIGEYLLRILELNSNKPAYLVRTVYPSAPIRTGDAQEAEPRDPGAIA